MFWETRQDKMVEELADLLEVITSICDITGLKLNDLVSLAEKKRVERGGFQSGIILIGTRLCQKTPIGRSDADIAR